MTTKTVPVSIRRLDAVVERIAPQGVPWEEWPPLVRGRRASKSRAKQLRATVRQLERAIEQGVMPRGSKGSVEALLSPRGVDAFLEAAARGELRHPNQGVQVGKPLSWSSRATLRDCLKILGEEAGLGDLVLPRVYRERLDLRPVPTPAQAAALYRRLADMAVAAPLDALMARTLAAVGVILDTAMRTRDMVSRRLEHLDVDAGTLEAQHHAQNASHLPDRAEVVELREGTVVALRRWLVFRRDLVAGLQGSDPGALWVTVSASAQPRPDGSWRTYEAGMPLRERGFARAHASGVDRLNTVLAGRWEGAGPWEPLPTRPEALRRAVELERQSAE